MIVAHLMYIKHRFKKIIKHLQHLATHPESSFLITCHVIPLKRREVKFEWGQVLKGKFSSFPIKCMSLK